MSACIDKLIENLPEKFNNQKVIDWIRSQKEEIRDVVTKLAKDRLVSLAENTDYITSNSKDDIPLDLLNQLPMLTETYADSFESKKAFYTGLTEDNKVDRANAKSLRDLFTIIEKVNNAEFNINGEKVDNKGRTIPLFEYDDFYTTFLANPDILGDRITPEQKDLLKRVAIFAAHFKKGIKKVLLADNPNNNVSAHLLAKSPLYLLLDMDTKDRSGTGDLTYYNPSLNPMIANVLATIAYNQLAIGGKETLFNDPEAINRILNRPPDAEVSTREQMLLNKVGLPATHMEETTFGNEAVRMLGIKLKEGQDPNTLANMKLALGQLITSVLRQENTFGKEPLLVQKTVLNSVLDSLNPTAFNEISDADKAANRNRFTRFLQINSRTKRNSRSLIAAPNVSPIIDNFSNKEDPTDLNTLKAVFNDIFNLSNKEVLPTLKPGKAETRVRNSFMELPEDVIKNLQDSEDTEWQLNGELFDTIESTGLGLREFLKEIIGYDSNASDNHIRIATKLEGKNIGYERVIDNSVKFHSIWKNVWNKSPFHLHYFVPANNRIVLDNNVLQPQNDKFQRFMVKHKDWTISIPAGNNGQKVLAFRSAIGLALDKSFDNVTRQKINKNFNDLYKELKQGGVLDAYERIQNGKGTEADGALLLKTVKSKKEGMHSLWGIMSMYSYHKAKTAKDKDFEINLPIETDAATSGVIIQLLQLPIAKGENNGIATVIEKLKAGGNAVDETFTDLGDFKGSGNNYDNYEQIGLVVDEVKGLMISLRPDLKEKFDLIDSVIDKFVDYDGDKPKVSKVVRNLVLKPILMVTNYGANIKTVIENYIYNLETNFYDRFYKLRRDGSPDAMEELRRLNDVFNQLIGTTKYDFSTMPIEQVKNFELEKINQGALNFFKASVESSYGEAIKEALNRQFGELGKARNMYNSAMQGIYTVFRRMYDDFIAENRNITDDEKMAWIIDNIEMAPVVLTPQAKKEMKEKGLTLKEALKYGVAGIKFSPVRQYRDENRSILDLGTELSSTDVSTGKVSKYKSVRGYSSVRGIADPGIGGFVLTIHSLDSANIQYKMGNRLNALPVHDAEVMGLDNAVDNTRDYNEGHYNLNKEYSLFQEMLDRVEYVFNRIGSSDNALRDSDLRALLRKLRGNISSITHEITDTDGTMKRVPVYPKKDIDRLLNNKQATVAQLKEPIRLFVDTFREINTAVQANRDILFNPNNKDGIVRVGQAVMKGATYSVPGYTATTAQSRINQRLIKEGDIALYKNEEVTVNEIYKDNSGKFKAKITKQGGKSTSVLLGSLSHIPVIPKVATTENTDIPYEEVSTEGMIKVISGEQSHLTKLDAVVNNMSTDEVTELTDTIKCRGSK